MPKLSFLILIALIVFAPAANAQESTTVADESLPPGAKSSTSVPLVYAQDLSVVAGENNTIAGAFTALSQEEKSIVSGLQYEVLVISPAPAAKDDELNEDSPIVYARVFPPDLFTLKPGESSQRTFTITTPPLPAGDYRVRVQMRLANDREMGWADAALTLQGTNPFVVLEPQSVEAPSTDVVTGEKRTTWAPLEGVNVTPGQAITIKANAKNSGAAPITAPLTITTRRLFNQDPVVTTVLPEPVTIPAGATAHNLTIPITAATTPGAYQLLITLKPEAGTAVSSIAEVRYVVTGVSASIISAKLTTPAVQKGEVATVDFTVVGPADRQTVHKGKLTVELLDETTVVGTTTNDVELMSGAIFGTATVELTQTILKHLALKLTVTSDAGAVLAAYEVHYPELKGTTDPETLPGTTARPLIMSSYILWGAIAGGALIILAIVGWLIRRHHRRPLSLPPIPPVALVLAGVALGIAGLFATSLPTSANGIQYGYNVGQGKKVKNQHAAEINIFVNSPLDQSNVDSAKIPYQAKITWSACGNQGSMSSILVMSRGNHSYEIDGQARYNSTQTIGWKQNWSIEPFFSSFFIGQDFKDYHCSNADIKKYYNGLTCKLNKMFDLGAPQWRAHLFTFGKTATQQGHPTFTSESNPSATLVLPISKLGEKATIATRVEVVRSVGTKIEILRIFYDFTWVTIGKVPQCRDGKDNDGDGKIDFTGPNPDPGCTSGTDDDETDPPPPPPPVLRPDLISRDLVPSSGAIKAGDTITFSGTIQNTGQATAGASQARYILDRTTGFAGIDLGSRSTKALAGNPVNEAQGQAASDNWVATAGDHTVELCADNINTVTESNETNNCGTPVNFTVAPAPQCKDGKDNDGDGAIDSGADFSCGGDSTKDDETLPKAQCQDDNDNDDDGKTDFGSGANNDPGCTSLQDNDETNTTATTPQCSDGIDNDGDGKTDFSGNDPAPANPDPGCSSATDDDESNTNVGGVEEVD